jgi:hypothetical protein
MVYALSCDRESVLWEKAILHHSAIRHCLALLIYAIYQQRSDTMGFARSSFGQFMASGGGRLVRIVAGIVLILIGYFMLEGAMAWIVAIIGLVPLTAGLFDFCVFSALFGGPFWGQAIRSLSVPQPR